MPEIRAKRAASNVLNVDAGYKLLEVAFVADNLMAEQLRGGNISNYLLLMGNIVSWILSFYGIEGIFVRGRDFSRLLKSLGIHWNLACRLFLCEKQNAPVVFFFFFFEQGERSRLFSLKKKRVTIAKKIPFASLARSPSINKLEWHSRWNFAFQCNDVETCSLSCVRKPQFVFSTHCSKRTGCSNQNERTDEPRFRCIPFGYDLESNIEATGSHGNVAKAHSGASEEREKRNAFSAVFQKQLCWITCRWLEVALGLMGNLARAGCRHVPWRKHRQSENCCDALDFASGALRQGDRDVFLRVVLFVLFCCFIVQVTYQCRVVKVEMQCQNGFNSSDIWMYQKDVADYLRSNSEYFPKRLGKYPPVFTSTSAKNC